MWQDNEIEKSAEGVPGPRQHRAHIRQSRKLERIDPVNALEVIVRDDLGLPRGLTLSFQNEPEKIPAIVRSAIKARAVQVAIASLHQIGIRTRNRRFRE